MTSRSGFCESGSANAITERSESSAEASIENRPPRGLNGLDLE